MSTGLDGETQDRLFKTPKPRVILPMGAIFCADSSCLEGHGSRASILGAELFSGRKLWYLRAEADLETEITGPSSVSEQINAAHEMLRLGAEKVLIDGSLDRKSIAFEDSVKAIVLCVGASFGSKEEIVEELKRLRLMVNISQYQFSIYRYKMLKESHVLMFRKKDRWYHTDIESLIKREDELRALIAENPDAIYIPTAYSSLLHAKLYPLFKNFNKEIIFRHPQCLHLCYKELFQLLRDCDIHCLIPFNVKLYALNPWAVGKSPVDAVQFRKYIRTMRPNQQFIDIMELKQ